MSLVALSFCFHTCFLRRVATFSFPSALCLCSNVLGTWLETHNNAANPQFLSLRKFYFFCLLPITSCRGSETFYCPILSLPLGLALSIPSQTEAKGLFLTSLAQGWVISASPGWALPARLLKPSSKAPSGLTQQAPRRQAGKRGLQEFR